MTKETAGQGPVDRVVRPGAEARHLPTPEDLRNYADDADQNRNHWVPISAASLRGMADEFDRLRAALLLAQRLCNEALPKFKEAAENEARESALKALMPDIFEA